MGVRPIRRKVWSLALRALIFSPLWGLSGAKNSDQKATQDRVKLAWVAGQSPLATKENGVEQRR